MADCPSRSILAMLGICAIVWAASVVLIYPRNALVAEAAQGVLSGNRFNAAQLSVLKRSLDATPTRTLRASDLGNAAVVRLLLFETELKAGKQPPASDLAELKMTVAAAIEQSPDDSFMWLTDFWLKRVSGEFVDSDWNLLRMSYESGPNEAWIAVRRNPLALGVFRSLPGGLAEQALSEFVGLVRSGLYADAANILAGPGWVIREQLLGRLVQVGEADRRAFAKVLASRNIDDVTVPGVDERPSRPF